MVNEGKVKSDEARIIGGPNKWDLVIKSLADSQDVIFEIHRQIGGKLKLSVEIKGLIKLGVTDEADWLVLGRVLDNFQNLGELFNDPRYFLRGKLALAEKPIDDPVYFWAKYHPHSRTGKMRIAIIDQNDDSPWDLKYFLF